MSKTPFDSLFRKTLIGLVILLFFLFIFISIRYTLHVNLVAFILEGFCFIFTLGLFVLRLDFKNKWVNWGLILISIAFFTDILGEIKFLTIPTDMWVNINYIVFEKAFIVMGIIVASYGTYISGLQRKSLINDLRHMALNDSLTGIPNRNLIADKLSYLINQSHSQNSLTAVFLIDLDNFKMVNDTFGHSFGDILLQKIAKKLKDCINDKCILGRISGDEFIVLVHDIYSLDTIDNLAEQIISEFKTPLFVQDSPVHITCSMGISIFPYDGCTVDTLIKNADLAMYRAKDQGKNNYAYYDSLMGESVTAKFEVTEDLRRALKNEEFVLHYQPKVNIIDNRITGFEALIRWNHPALGFLYPDNFISIAEETGLIKNIDEHVLELACLQIKEWLSKGFDPLNIAVNISADFFNEKNFIDKVEAILTNTQIDPSHLSIEITETLAVKNTERTHWVLTCLKNRGIKILLDDFGKGYSSLSYLKSSPIDTLKIDRIFINGISENIKDEALIQAIVYMSKALEIQIVAEGVEHAHQLQFLDKLGCNEYQGYLFSKPLAANQIENMFLSGTSTC